jgi:Holliday junction DNA helicase RuvA
MFAFLRGAIALKGVGHVAIDVHGAGYLVFVPESVQRKVVIGQEVILLTYCHIREDSFQIFGFLKEEEKALFEMLLGVQNVGPKVALSVLSTFSMAQFAAALHENDVKALTKAPGVGTKMAQRILVEMKTKLGQEPELNAILGAPKSVEDEAEGDDVFEALIAMGCTPAEAKKAAAAARKKLGEGAVDEELVRAALRSMARVR